ncbi:50S ribosomal protein L31 [Candidatus Wolfebacteria bacterium RIFCSPLOWO2_01_FULL_38_11]|uniref:Large ribosomal subunit protein bL31 n=1 Tax=Candidatus Wolfebacteria bacterium RIFCSPLOWO2_01_FULL_38_11 TaxID=1802556 RepID=A0A1F8DT58_9BACT|nr:MAG: 50S ribosomal protein L31 [Candidatus Wolfebacteria bacterium RIFCSPLOWO2_01_FULL_38_11]
MKKNIHPQYHQNAEIKCACGASFVIGSTKPEIHTEICSHCHPFYTGKEKLIDTMGRVERFKSRTSKKKEIVKKVRIKKQQK